MNGWRQKIIEDMLNLTRERDATAEQMKKGTLRRGMVMLTARSTAMVQDIAKLSQGSVAQAAEKMFTLVPIGTALDAEVQIEFARRRPREARRRGAHQARRLPVPEARHAGRQGAHAERGCVQARHAEPGSGTDAYYVSRIDLGKGALKHMEPHARLLPGMTLTAEIVVGKRTVLSYFMWPLTKGMGEAIREP